MMEGAAAESEEEDGSADEESDEESDEEEWLKVDEPFEVPVDVSLAEEVVEVEVVVEEDFPEADAMLVALLTMELLELVPYALAALQ